MDPISTYLQRYSKGYQKKKKLQEDVSSFDEAMAPRLQATRPDDTITHTLAPISTKRNAGPIVRPASRQVSSQELANYQPANIPSGYRRTEPGAPLTAERETADMSAAELPALASERGVSETGPFNEESEGGMPIMRQPEDAKPQTLSQRWANLDDATKRRLGLSALVSGLGILSKQRYSTMPQSPLADIGEGGLMGVQTYMTLEQRDEANRLRQEGLNRQTLRDSLNAMNQAEQRRLQGERNQILERREAGLERWRSPESPLGQTLTEGAKLKRRQAEQVGKPTTIDQVIVQRGGEDLERAIDMKTVPPEKIFRGGATGDTGSQQNYIYSRNANGEREIIPVGGKFKTAKSQTEEAQAIKGYAQDRQSLNDDYSKAMGKYKSEVTLAIKATGNSQALAMAASANNPQALLTALSGSGLPKEKVDQLAKELTKIHDTYREAKGKINDKWKRKSYWDDALDNGEAMAAEPAPSGGATLSTKIPKFNFK